VYGTGCGFAHRAFLIFTGIHFDAVGFDKVLSRHWKLSWLVGRSRDNARILQCLRS